MNKRKDELLDIEPNETETFSIEDYPMVFRQRSDLQVMKHVTLTCSKEHLRWAILADKKIFGEYLSARECPICWGRGVIGGVEETHILGVVAAFISPESLRECPLCKGSGALALDVVTMTYYRIAVAGDASVETKIKELKKEYNQTTNQRKEQPWKQ